MNIYTKAVNTITAGQQWEILRRGLTRERKNEKSFENSCYCSLKFRLIKILILQMKIEWRFVSCNWTMRYASHKRQS